MPVEPVSSVREACRRLEPADRRGGLGLALDPDGVVGGLGVASADRAVSLDVGVGSVASAVAELEARLRPRWVVWSAAMLRPVLRAGSHPARVFEVAAVHRLLFGGAKDDAGRAWAAALGLDPSAGPGPEAPGLLAPAEDDLAGPVDEGGRLGASLVAGSWRASPTGMAEWASLGVVVANAQRRRLEGLARSGHPRATLVAHAESAAALLAEELGEEGVPFDRQVAEAVLGEAEAERARCLVELARELPGFEPGDAASPKRMAAHLRTVGIDVPDTRAWRLRPFAGSVPAVTALLAWRRADRLCTTFGRDWLDARLGVDGRLRGRWAASDGAAGRMTATGGLANLPAALRAAVRAEPGFVLVRADLDQVEPRVLAAVSGDRALAQAAAEADLYQSVASALGVDRATAKVAVLGAMYAQRSGLGGEVLPLLRRAYPEALAYLERGEAVARAGRSLRTWGGRLLVAGPAGGGASGPARAARGRYGRNALVQGAAAELFKTWAVTVRARLAGSDARIVLCLHDELLVHAPRAMVETVVKALTDGLAEAAARWVPEGCTVPFGASVAVVERWSEVG